MTIFQHKTTFGRGEVDAGLYDRFDVDFYASAAERLENWFPELTGGAFVRPGLENVTSQGTGLPAQVLFADVAGADQTLGAHLAVITVREVDYVVMFHEPADETRLYIQIYRIAALSGGALQWQRVAQEDFPQIEDTPPGALSERICTAVVGPSMFITAPGYAPMRAFITTTVTPATAGVELITFYEELLGTVEVENGASMWAGVDTLFDEQLAVGDVFRFRGNFYEVATIPSNTSMTTVETYTDLTVAGERIEVEATDPFDGSSPRLCAFFRGRLHLFSSSTKPTTWWASRAQDPFVIVPGTTYDDAPIEYDLLTQDADTFLWVFSGDRLYLGGSRGEYTISAPPDSGLTPTGFSFDRTSTVGSSGAQPAFSDASLLFVNRAGTQVIASTFDDSRQGFVTQDISLLAPHLLQAGVQSLAFRPSVRFDRSPRLFALTKENQLRACSFQPEQDVAAWSRVNVSGAAYPAAIASSSDRLYVLMMQRDEGATETDFTGYLTTLGSNEDRYFTMDFAQSVTPLNGTFNITGLLVDQIVAVVSENRGFLGFFQADGTLVNLGEQDSGLGELTVGLAFSNEIRLLPVVVDDKRGGSHNRKHRLVRVLVSVRDTRQMFVRGEPIFGGVGSTLGQELEPQTGVYERRALGWAYRDQVDIQSASVYKSRLLSVTREVSI